MEVKHPNARGLRARLIVVRTRYSGTRMALALPLESYTVRAAVRQRHSRTPSHAVLEVLPQVLYFKYEVVLLLVVCDQVGKTTQYIPQYGYIHTDSHTVTARCTAQARRGDKREEYY